MIDLKTSQDTADVIELLAACMGPSFLRVMEEFSRYRADASRSLLGFTKNDELIGLIGISHEAPHEVLLLHMAVKEPYRNQGIGRTMIQAYIQDNQIRRMEAETDRDAVDFYRQIGFQTRSIGEKYPGVERFICLYKSK
ncbi:GNAT family N-acetyltransferase [Paenibacillus mendelii]|uniref:GNAT family N-acetyltransferase n=1 Tax=Paenibacillus mendelii TaxID=206163 RepID=A0ABV6JFX4_9BACL|nr:GNAT family N-acetyltransferase [Paenibacillus mendelii]MCQ6557655.1 GNAT family N-acetyltransferase [Paenibacillus mendelii]